MSMLTRCPSCSTAFRVTPEQLQARHGRVRCGHCATAFNAFDSLATLPAIEPDEEATPKPATEKEYPAGKPAIEAVKETAPVIPAPPAEKRERFPRPAYAAAAELLMPQLDDYAGVLERPKRSRPWVLGSLLLMMIFAGQLAYQFRTELATVLPGTRPYLEMFCEYLACTVPLPQQAEYLNIESSDLKADPQRPGVILLSATLRNNAPFVQGFPALELTLTDTQDQPVARRIFLPTDYLASKTGSRTGIAPNRAVDLRVALGVTDLPAAGYRLYLFYP